MSESTEAIIAKQKDLYEVVESEVVWLKTIWFVFIQLYGTDDERIELLTESASEFFGVIKQLLIFEFIASLNRLADPPKSLGHDNASLDQLIKQINPDTHSQIVTKLKIELEEIRTLSKPFKGMAE